MPESKDRLVLGKLNHLAYKQELFQVADTALATVSNPACFALWNAGGKGIPVRLISVRVSTDTAGQITFGRVLTNPALNAGNTPSNLWLGGMAPEAANQAQVTSAPTIAQVINEPWMAADSTLELLSPGVIYMPPQSGVAIVSPTAAQNVSVVWLWAELPPGKCCDACGPIIIVAS